MITGLAHACFTVSDLERSLAFYRDALGLIETRRKEPEDKSFILVFLGDEKTGHKLELTWLRDREEPYNLGDGEFHLALRVDDYDSAFAHHKKMSCVCCSKNTRNTWKQSSGKPRI